jgi:glycosyltransferase involved in cell wall biosynthesis
MRKAVQRNPGCRLAVMFHEDFVPPINWKFAIMRQWQRWQFKALGRAADVIFFSIDPWVRRYAPWFAGKPVLHLPVGSNIPKVQITRAEARERLGIRAGQIVLGLFGLVSGARNVQWLTAAVEAAERSHRDVILLYIGAHGPIVRDNASGISVIADGPFPADEVSRRLQAIDVFLSPMGDGVSTRRGSMMAGLQHGLATVGTRGWATDDVLAVEHRRSIMLADVNSLDEYKSLVMQLIADGELRERVGKGAAVLYDREFAWSRIAARMLDALRLNNAAG